MNQEEEEEEEESTTSIDFRRPSHQTQEIRAHTDEVLRLTRDISSEELTTTKKKKKKTTKYPQEASHEEYLTSTKKTLSHDDDKSGSFETKLQAAEARSAAVSERGAIAVRGIDPSSEFREDANDSEIPNRRKTVTAIPVDPVVLEEEIRQQMLEETVMASVVVRGEESGATAQTTFTQQSHPAAGTISGDVPFWKRPLYMGTALLLLVAVVVVVVVVAVVLAPSGTTSDQDSTIPTSIPTTAPSLSPTTLEPTTMAPTASPVVPLTQQQAKLLANLKRLSFDQGKALEDVSSPQYKAFAWLLQDPAGERTDSRVFYKQLARYSLAVLFYSTGGENWINKEDWLSQEDACNWYLGPDTFCERRGGVPGLRLINNNLTGTIPPEIASAMLSMTFLDLSDNKLTGTVPPQLFPSPYKMESIRLNRNRLTGSIPTEFHTFVNPETLYRGNEPTTVVNELSISGNRLSGPIPSELASLSALRFLNLQENSLTGSLPPELATMQDILVVRVEYNQINGTIPEEYGEWSSLRTAYFDHNLITGLVPESICSLLPLRFSADCREVQCPCCTHCCNEFNDFCEWTELGPEPTDREDRDDFVGPGAL